VVGAGLAPGRVAELILGGHGFGKSKGARLFEVGAIDRPKRTLEQVVELLFLRVVHRVQVGDADRGHGQGGGLRATLHDHRAGVVEALEAVAAAEGLADRARELAWPRACLSFKCPSALNVLKDTYDHS
jgi:hypothetical protein